VIVEQHTFYSNFSETLKIVRMDSESGSFSGHNAIYDSDTFETDEETRCHDNVERCVAFLEGRWRQKPDKKKEKPEDVESDPVLERQFLPDQLPTASRGRKQFRHVLRRMEEFTSASGPLFMLRLYRDHKTRVKVTTRGVAGVRGVTSGFIAAFDKHWNLVLTDVDEEFTRRRHRKTPVYGGEAPSTGAGGGDAAVRQWRVGQSEFRIVKIKRKVEVCVRHVPQVLLRGEHVVSVSPEDPVKLSDDNTDQVKHTDEDTEPVNGEIQ